MGALEDFGGDVQAGVPTGVAGPTPAVASRTQLSRGRIVGRYVIVGELGGGGMGVVYRAYDPELDRPMALKLLHRGEEGHASEVRLLREGQAMARLSHPNVIVVHDVGTHEGHVFLAMEYVEGQTLRQWMSAEPRDWRAVLDVFTRAGEGLAAAHRAQLVHRDFKPDNVLIGDDGRLRVVDFGLAHFADATDSEELAALDAASATLSVSLTQTGVVMGTPAYMSPEQVVGEIATERSDQFSFCVALYEGLYGERPFTAGTVADLVAKISSHLAPEPTSGSSVPGWLRRVVLRGLAKSSGDRYPNMEALLRELRRDPGRRRSRALRGVGVVGLSLTTGMAAANVGQADVAFGAAAAEHVAMGCDAQRECVDAASFDEGLSAASFSADGATSQLDAYVREWIERHEQACFGHRHR